MGMEDHPVFHNKDASNNRIKPFRLPTVRQIMRMTPDQIRQLETDLVFVEMIENEWGKL